MMSLFHQYYNLNITSPYSTKTSIKLHAPQVELLLFSKYRGRHMTVVFRQLLSLVGGLKSHDRTRNLRKWAVG